MMAPVVRRRAASRVRSTMNPAPPPPPPAAYVLTAVSWPFGAGTATPLAAEPPLPPFVHWPPAARSADGGPGWPSTCLQLVFAALHTTQPPAPPPPLAARTPPLEMVTAGASIKRVPPAPPPPAG